MERFARVLYLLGSHHFRLMYLLLEDRVGEFIALVENGDFSLSILADGHLGFVQGIGGTIGLDLIDHVFELEGEVLGE
jgi:hypothetical protein